MPHRRERQMISRGHQGWLEPARRRMELLRERIGDRGRDPATLMIGGSEPYADGRGAALNSAIER